MSEFMLITPPPVMEPPHPDAGTDPEKILRHLLACLKSLDNLGAQISAAYLDTAIHHFRDQFAPGSDTSGSD